MVLGPKIGLDPLALLGAAPVNVLACFVGSYKRNGFDSRLVDNEVNSWSAAVYNVEDARWKTSFASKLGENHTGAGIPLGGLEDDAITSNDGDGKGPQWNHGREVYAILTPRVPTRRPSY